MTITDFLEARISEDESAEKNGGAYWEDCYGEDCHERMIAECAAKRKMLDNIPKGSDIFDPLGGTSFYVLLCLAAVYAAHPDYQEEWAL